MGLQLNAEEHDLLPKSPEGVTIAHRGVLFITDSSVKVIDPEIQAAVDFKQADQCAVVSQKAMGEPFRVTSKLS